MKRTARADRKADAELVRIAVLDVAAEHGGALAVLEEFHSAAARARHVDWEFYLSAPLVEEGPHLGIRIFPWVKKSWFHRLFFDMVGARRLIRDFGADAVLSLQNLAVPGVSRPQVIYVHQSLPFSDIRYSPLRAPTLFLYQVVIARLMFWSIGRAHTVVVQNHHMRAAIVDRLRTPAKKIRVLPPDVTPPEGWVPRPRDGANRCPRFLYPAGPSPHKNHAQLLQACDILAGRGVADVEVLVTVTAEQLRRLGFEKPAPCVRAVGRLSRSAVWSEYCDSVLVFPSEVETVGLPLLEATIAGIPVIAADAPYAREALRGYPNASFFQLGDASALADAMERAVRGGTGSAAASVWHPDSRTSWDELVDLVATVGRGDES